MKTRILQLSFITIFSAVLFSACKKEETRDNTGNEMAAHSDDQARFSTEVDAVANDANIALESEPAFSGRTGQTQVICNANVSIDTVSNPRTITIIYNGPNCWNSVNRTGSVVLSMAQGVHWKDAGAVLTVNYQNLRIRRLTDNKSITINGIQNFTNVSGGLLVNLPQLGTITHSITSNGLSVTFDDNTQSVWLVARQRVFTYNNGITITSTGTHSDGAQQNIAEWGTNRFGQSFLSKTTQPFVVRQDCSFRLVSGEVTHITPNASAVATFGLDSNGSPVVCPAGSFYFKLVWTGLNGTTFTVLLPY